MNATTSIHGLEEVLADDGGFSPNEAHRDPRNPAWTCFDDDREIDPDLKAFREDLLSFEEWNAGREAPTDETVQVGMFTVHRSIREWDEPDAKLNDWRERQESRARANWIIGFYKRMMANPSNDRWHKVIKALALQMGDEDLDLALNPVLELKKVVKERIKYAPGPIDGTVFKNPDGSVYRTQGTNPGAAKAAYIKRHEIEEEFVSIDRVQYEGKRTSQYVVGTRKVSDQTPSNYFDPNPAWKDEEGGSYAPRACSLFMVGKSMTMPSNSHRLTIREFEQALIAGAECFDSEDEALADSIASDFYAEGSGFFEENDADPMSIERIYDGRVSLMETGLGTCGRRPESLTYEEDYLLGILRMIGDERGAELMMLSDQEPNMIHRHMMSCGSYDGVVSLLQFVNKDNPELLEYVTKALCGDEELDHEEVPMANEIYSAAVALFDDDSDAWSVPTGPNGACKRAACLNWK